MAKAARRTKRKTIVRHATTFGISDKRLHHEIVGFVIFVAIFAVIFGALFLR